MRSICKSCHKTIESQYEANRCRGLCWECMLKSMQRTVNLQLRELELSQQQLDVMEKERQHLRKGLQYISKHCDDNQIARFAQQLIEGGSSRIS